MSLALSESSNTIRLDPFRDQVIEYLADKTGQNRETLEQAVSPPRDPKLGDYAFPCFPLAKELKKSPVQIAAELAEAFEPGGGIQIAEAAGPYLNFRIDPVAIVEMTLDKIAAEGERYGSPPGTGQVIALDFSSPNIAKPFGIHHLRTTVIGNSLYQILTHLGNQVIRINHLGDWGTQFGQVIAAFQRWGDEKELEAHALSYLVDLYVRFNQEVKEDPALKDEGRMWFRKLEEGDATARQLWQHFRELSIEDLKGCYRRLGIEFDSYEGEAFYEDKLDDAVARLEQRGITTISDGALVVDLSEFDMPPCLLRKSDGASLYATRDVAAALYRREELRAEKVVYVVAAQQSLHFRQFFKVLEMMDPEWKEDFIHVSFGMMRFEGMKMSTREGTFILLDEVLDEAEEAARKLIEEKSTDLEDPDAVARMVGMGALIFGDLKNDRVNDVVFRLDEAINPDGDTAPYIQYVHARICGILRKYNKPIPKNVEYSLLTEKEEVALAKILYEFPRVVASAGEHYKPHLIARYLLRLAKQFHVFYHNRRVLDAGSQQLVEARVLLVDRVREVIRLGMSLLGIEVSERM